MDRRGFSSWLSMPNTFARASRKWVSSSLVRKSGCFCFNFCAVSVSSHRTWQATTTRPSYRCCCTYPGKLRRFRACSRTVASALSLWGTPPHPSSSRAHASASRLLIPKQILILPWKKLPRCCFKKSRVLLFCAVAHFRPVLSSAG
jgi:hypothetical protein